MCFPVTPYSSPNTLGHVPLRSYLPPELYGQRRVITVLHLIGEQPGMTRALDSLEPMPAFPTHLFTHNLDRLKRTAASSHGTNHATQGTSPSSAPRVPRSPCAFACATSFGLSVRPGASARAQAQPRELWLFHGGFESQNKLGRAGGEVSL